MNIKKELEIKKWKEIFNLFLKDMENVDSKLVLKALVKKIMDEM